MYFVYVIQSLQDDDFYTGFTRDLEQRVEEHNKGNVDSTRNRKPFKLIYSETCLNKKDALARERYLKTGMGKKYIRNRLKYYLKSA